MEQMFTSHREMQMKPIKHLYLLIFISVTTACSSNSKLSRFDIDNYQLDSSSTIPFTVLKLKDSNTDRSREVSPGEINQVFNTKAIHHETHALEFSEQIKVWSYSALALGFLGLSSSAENKGPFSILAAIGLIGSTSTVLYQQEQIASIRKKLNKKQSKDQVESDAEYEVENSDFEDTYAD